MSVCVYVYVRVRVREKSNGIVCLALLHFGICQATQAPSPRTLDALSVFI